MKNKRLIATICALTIFLIGSFIYEKKKSNEVTIQESSELLKIGVLQFVSHPALDEIYNGIKQGLKEEGLIDGKNIIINFQNGQADQSKLATMSQQLAQNKPDVLIGIATPAAQALANTTKTIPIVLGAVTDPVGAGLVDSIELPGGNITGVSDQPPVAAQIKLAKSLLPTAKTFGILYASSEDNSQYQVEAAELAAKELGLSVKKYAVPSTNEIAQTIQVMRGQVDFLYIPLDNTIANATDTVISEANKMAIPVFPSVDTMVQQGGVATIGINQFDLGVQTGKMAAQLAKGETKAATTPIYTFTEGTVILNQAQLDRFNITPSHDITDQATFVEEEKE